MNIYFICSGLEPGKDAVGDYTVELARRVAATGAEVSIVALADRHVAERSEEIRSGCRAIRLPKQSAWGVRWQQLLDHVRESRPDWVSLQWVAFGYQDKGLPWSFGRRFRQAIGDVSLHVMCHEIWVRADGSGTLKDRLYSRLQRAVHRRCFAAFRSACVHTHAEPYRRALKSIGVSASILPLGSNIHPHDCARREITNEDAGHISDDSLIFIVFGNTPPEWDARKVIETLGRACTQMHKHALVRFIGKGGPTGHELERLVCYGAEIGVRVEHLGFLPAEAALDTMRRADVGLATVPFALWQKSSAVAAMRSCGLPICFSRFDGDWPEDWLPRWEDGFFQLQEDAIITAVNRGKGCVIDPWQDAACRFLAEVNSPFKKSGTPCAVPPSA